MVEKRRLQQPKALEYVKCPQLGEIEEGEDGHNDYEWVRQCPSELKDEYGMGRELQWLLVREIEE